MTKKFLSVFLICCLIFVMVSEKGPSVLPVAAGVSEKEKDYIKWVDFDITYQAMEDAMNTDIETFEQDLHIKWVDILAYLAAKYGGDFSQYARSDLDKLVNALQEGSSMEQLTAKMKYFPYYIKAYSAVIGNYLGMRKDGTYGLTACSPVAEGYWYTDSDDFGNGRDYGFARKHLGHDMFCSTGTPIVAVESGKVEALGWNQYGGWRIGIRSKDGFRYYYYAHLRKDSPYAKGLKEGAAVKAGQIIGYSGQTGYSIKENVNNINVPHLHFGIELIFDESQKECNAEIWIDTYALTKLLMKHRSGGTTEQTAPADHETATSVPLPILMYHGLTRKESQVNNYFIPAYTFESDMKYLKENGYTAITMTELIDYVCDEDGTAALPEKPVLITFDDGYCNNYNYGTPILKKYGMKAVISVIGHACEEASAVEYRSEDYCNVTWDQLKEMTDSGLWEAQNHTYDFHDMKNGRKGASRKPGESEAAYEKLLKDDLSILQEKIKEVTGSYPNTFTWPFGAYTKEIRSMLKKMGFKATLSCSSGINEIKKGDAESLFLMKRYLRDPKSPISKLLE